MDDKKRILILTVMEMIGETVDLYKKDPHYAPPSWILDNWWYTLNAALTSSSSDDEQDA